jgi:hypothetical protein
VSLDLALQNLREYTAAVLAFRLDEPPAPPPIPLPPAQLQNKAAQTARLAGKRGADAVILLGAGCGEFAAALAQAAAVPVLVSELSPARARSVLAESLQTSGENLALLADSSPWAHLLLWSLAGLAPHNALLALNPELPPESRAQAQALQRTFASSRILDLETEAPPGPDIALAAMLHPDEPDLAGFLDHLPESAASAALLWDAAAPPEDVLPCPLPLRQDARPLRDDFSAQRNRMLELADAEWVFYLDADERVPHELDRLLPALARLDGVHGVHFPRLTLYPDEHSFKAGYGLWPDLQLRLFRKGPNVRFERPIHERLEGLPGPRAVLLDAHILHLSRLLKRPEQIEAKLARFDAAGAARHRLNVDYPRLPLEWLERLIRPDSPRVLLA